MLLRSILVLAVASLSGRAFAEGPYGAIAYSEPLANTSVVTDQPSQAEAEAAAIASCRDRSKSDPDSCKAVLWYYNACGAMARASDGSWGTGWGDTQELAKRWAIDGCDDYGARDCKIKLVMCSPGGGGYISAN